MDLLFFGAKRVFLPVLTYNKSLPKETKSQAHFNNFLESLPDSRPRMMFYAFCYNELMKLFKTFITGKNFKRSHPQGFRIQLQNKDWNIPPQTSNSMRLVLLILKINCAHIKHHLIFWAIYFGRGTVSLLTSFNLTYFHKHQSRASGLSHQSL